MKSKVIIALTALAFLLPGGAGTTKVHAADGLGVRLELPTVMAHPGEEFWVRGYLENPGPEVLYDVPVCFVLEVHGEYWFWPSWAHYAPPEFTDYDLDWLEIPVGSSTIEVVEPFTWPDTGDAMVLGLYFHGLMLTDDMSAVRGAPARVEFGYGPRSDTPTPPPDPTFTPVATDTLTPPPNPTFTPVATETPPNLTAISPTSGPPGKALRLEGTNFHTDEENIHIVVGEQVLPIVAKGVSEDGLRDYVVSVIPFTAPGYYPVKLTVNGLESNSMVLEITELPSSGKPLGQVLQEVTDGFDGLCVNITDDLLPDAVALGLLPVEAEADFSASMERANSIFHAFSATWQTLPDHEKAIIESLLAQNGLDEIFNQMGQRAYRDFNRGQWDVAAADMCLMLDATSSALSVVDSAWTLVDLASIIAALASGGLSAPAAGGAIGIHFAIKAVDAVIDGVLPTDLQEVSFQGYGDTVNLAQNQTLDLVTIGRFDNQETPIAATLGMILDAILASLPLPQTVKEEIMEFIIDLLAQIDLDLFEGLLGDDIMAWGDPAPVNLSIDFGQYADGIDWQELMAPTIFGALGDLLVLIQEFGMYICDTGVVVEPGDKISYSFNYEHLFLTGEELGNAVMILTGMKLMAVDGWVGYILDLDIPRSVESTFYITITNPLTATPRPTSTPISTPTPGPSPTPPPAPTGFVYIAPGSFTMGSPSDEACRYSDETQHFVTLTHGFYMMATEVTRRMWADLRAVQPTLPSDPSYTGHSPTMNHPVQYNTWYESVLFANLMSVQYGFTRCYYKDSGFTTPVDASNYTSGTFYCNFNATGYRLPTEAEWEYACRAGTTGPFSCNEPNYNSGNCSSCTAGTHPTVEQYCVYCANDPGGTEVVGSKLPNPAGLYDIHGNVWEWCWDWYAGYPAGSVTDPTGPSSGSRRVGRGGSWGNYVRACRSADRGIYLPGARGSLGFRLLRISS